MKKLIFIALLVISGVIAYTQLTIFVVQPIGTITEGKTIVMLRMEKTQFIDSADAMCEREFGSVNLLCRGLMMAAVANGEELFRLPYSDFLYGVSTCGKRYNS